MASASSLWPAEMRLVAPVIRPSSVRPFQGDSAGSILYAIVHKDPRSIREVNPRLPEATQPIVTRALKKDKAEGGHAILAVGYRVRSARGTAFRQWATARLSELLIKGFTLDDERIKAGRTLEAVKARFFQDWSSDEKAKVSL